VSRLKNQVEITKRDITQKRDMLNEQKVRLDEMRQQLLELDEDLIEKNLKLKDLKEQLG